MKTFQKNLEGLYVWLWILNNSIANRTAAYPISSRAGLSPGQVIAVATDGICKARNRNQNMFGKKRFQDLIRRHHRLIAEDILNAIFGALKNHTKGVRQDDDITLVIIKLE